MIHEIDQDSNGEIDFNEFVAVMSRKVNATYTSEQVKSAFKAFEGNASAPGYIKADKLLIALTTYGADKLSPEQAQELISQVRVCHNSPSSLSTAHTSLYPSSWNPTNTETSTMSNTST